MKRFIVFVAALLVVAGFGVLLYINSLDFKVQKALKGKECKVSAALIYEDKIWTYNDKKVPLLSVFKYFVTLSVLDKIEKEKLSLNDKILVKPNMVSKTTYSPMLKKYKPPFKISVTDLMKFMMSESDNNATDILIDYVGGLQKVRENLSLLGFSGVEIFADEKMMNEDIEAQYLNRARVLDVVKSIKTVRDGDFLSDGHKKFLDKVMVETTTGEDKIKAGLPKDVVFGHKTGSSSRKPDGVKIADNDAGFVILPDGGTLYIAVFVTESKMSDSENAALIAQIARIIYNKIVAQK